MYGYCYECKKQMKKGVILGWDNIGAFLIKYECGHSIRQLPCGIFWKAEYDKLQFKGD